MIKSSDSGKSEKSIANNSDVDCKLLIDNLIELLMIPDSIQVIYDSPIPSLKIPETQVSQIFQNLISNAVKYTPEGGRIIIDVKHDETEIYMTIKDNGPGVSAEDIPHLFEKCYRTNSAKNSEIEGTGLGLSIARAIVEEHQGRISIESELGRGTTVCIILPR